VCQIGVKVTAAQEK